MDELLPKVCEYLQDVIKTAKQEERRANIQKYGVVAEQFYAFDADGSGFLDTSEVADFCAKLGMELSTPEEVAAAVAEIEAGGSQDGEISLEEFVQWWQSDSAVKQSGSVGRKLASARDAVFGAEVGGGSPMG